MDTTTSFIISGFKNYKATFVNPLTWSVIERVGGKPIGKIGLLRTQDGEEWHFYAHDTGMCWLTWEQLLDLSGLIKKVMRAGNEVPAASPLDDRLTLYMHLKEKWKQIHNEVLPKTKQIREGYTHPKNGTQFYVSYKLKDGDIDDMEFYRTGSFTGKLTIKLIRMELSFIKKLANI